MKIFGHPIHIMLVHFPSALFPMALILSIIGYYTENMSFVESTFYTMCGGAVFGWIAIIFGALDLLRVQKEKQDAIKTALLHGTINGTVVTVFTVLAFMQYINYPTLKPNSLGVIIIEAITIVFMIGGNYLGGNLILKYKVAVDNE